MGKMDTDVARDATKLVISDDNFATIVAGIEQVVLELRRRFGTPKLGTRLEDLLFD